MEDSTANGRSTAVTGLHSLLKCPTTQGQVPSGPWGHGRATHGPCAPPVCPRGPVGPTSTGHSRHGAPCPFGRYWSFGLLVLGGGREVTSLPSAASTEATAERKAYLAQAFSKIICGAGCTCLLSIEGPLTQLNGGARLVIIRPAQARLVISC